MYILQYHYQDQSCPQAAELLKEEIITYSVLSKILQGQCAHIITDLETYIVCHSDWPYPVWIWCKDEEDRSSVNEIGRCIREKLPLEQGYSHILSYGLLDKLRDMDSYFRDAREGMGLLSYRLDRIHFIHYPCEGYMSNVREEEIAGLLDLWHDMHMEMEGHDISREHAYNTMQRMVGKDALYAWRLNNGRIAALTGKANQGAYSKITSVYTLPEYRRNGFAINLVYG